MSNNTSQEILINALRDANCYPHAANNVQVIETHISWIVLAGRYAYKIKKAVDLGFLNYADLAARRFFCDEEIRLNRRTAPDIYLDTVAIGGDPAAPKIGAHPALEYAVRMRRFVADDLMDRMLLRGEVTPSHIDTLAAAMVRFHAGLPVVDSDSPYGTAAGIRLAARQNFVQMRELLPEDGDRASLAALLHASEEEFVACQRNFETRRSQGFVRECHGDLHLGNIALVGDVPVPFDCIEFSPALRWIDVMDEVAFAMMDLLYHDHPWFAWRFLNAVLDANGDYAGVSVLRFYLAYRAAVRAKVCAIRAGQAGISKHAKREGLEDCRSYLNLARQCLARCRPALIITHGLPGSGKTTFSQFVLEQLGAIRIRSDVERKRLYGLGAQESSRSQGDIYGQDATQTTYARLHELAQQSLRAGYTVIVDAAFLKLEERERFRSLANDMCAPFVIASLLAKDATLRERILQRRNDASEADAAVLDKLQKLQQPLSPEELAWSVCFTTEEAPDSTANSKNWRKLNTMLSLA